MNTREQVELDTMLTEFRGEFTSLKERVTRLEDAQPTKNNHPGDCVCDGCMDKTVAWEVTYNARNSTVVRGVFLVYKMSEVYRLIENAPAGVSIEVKPMTKE